MAMSPRVFWLGALLVGFLLPFQAIAQDLEDDDLFEDSEETVVWTS